MNNRQLLMLELFRFGCVGVVAAAVHFCLVMLAVTYSGMLPLVANIFAFAIAFQVSYWGHRLFTFRGTNTSHRSAFSKLVFIQLINLAANESLFYIFLSMNLPYPLALFFTLTILPLFTFISTRFWVFKH